MKISINDLMLIVMEGLKVKKNQTWILIIIVFRDF